MTSRLIQRSLHADPPLALRGEGIFIHDSNGRTIIDGSGGAAVA
jgi:adenosylmethionine-8-amino-7-oxononanoate aminotransferase